MKASDVINELQKRIEIYGDLEVVIREFGGDMDIDVLSVFGDDDSERIVISNVLSWD